MLTAPIFSPIKRRPPSLVKSYSSPSGLDERCKSQGTTLSSPLSTRPAMRRSPSSYTGTLSLYEDDDLSERLSPAGMTTDWKVDLDHWIVKREDDVPPPELGHEGMPRADRRQAIDNALLWLRDEMKRMREEDDQLKQDFTNLYSEVHSMKMEAEKTQIMLRYRSMTSISSLAEISSDSDSDPGGMNDFADSSMVGNISTDSLIRRQKQRKAVSAALLTPPSLRRQVLTPGRAPISIRKRKVGKIDRHQLQSTPIKSTPETPETVYEVPFLPRDTPQAQLHLPRRLDLGNDIQRRPDLGNDIQRRPDLGNDAQRRPDLGNDIQRRPDLGNDAQRRPDLGNDVQRRPDLGNDANDLTPETSNKRFEPVQSTPAAVPSRAENSTGSNKSGKHDKTVSAPSLCQSEQKDRDITCPHPKQSKTSTSTPSSKTDISEASQRSQTPAALPPRRESVSSRQDSLNLLVKANSPKLKRRVISVDKDKRQTGRNNRRGSPMPSLIPKVGGAFTGGSPQATAPVTIASSTPILISAKPMAPTPINEPNNDRFSYVSPPNIRQTPSPHFPDGAIPRSQSAQLYQQEQLQQQEVIAAAASLQSLPQLPAGTQTQVGTQAQSGTLPRARKTHRRTSSSSSVGDQLAFLHDTPRSTLTHGMPGNGQEIVHSRSQSLTVEPPQQLNSMPSIRDAGEGAPFHSRLRGSSEFSKYEFESYDSPVAAQIMAVVHSSSGRNVDRSKPLHKRPQAMPSPFFTPTPPGAPHGYHEPDLNVPSPVMESPTQHYHGMHVPSHSPSPGHRRTHTVQSPPGPSSSNYQSHHHPDSDYQQYHMRHHSADYTASLASMKQGSETSPLTWESDPSNTSERRVSLDMVPALRTPAPGSYEPGYGSIGRRAGKKFSLSLPPSPGIADSSMAPGSPKVSRSHSDAQRNLAKTVALRCAQAAAAAPASPSLRRISDYGSMFPFPTTEEQSLPGGGGLVARRSEHSSMESLV